MQTRPGPLVGGACTWHSSTPPTPLPWPAQRPVPSTHRTAPSAHPRTLPPRPTRRRGPAALHAGARRRAGWARAGGPGGAAAAGGQRGGDAAGAGGGVPLPGRGLGARGAVHKCAAPGGAALAGGPGGPLACVVLFGGGGRGGGRSLGALLAGCLVAQQQRFSRSPLLRRLVPSGASSSLPSCSTAAVLLPAQRAPGPARGSRGVSPPGPLRASSRGGQGWAKTQRPTAPAAPPPPCFLQPPAPGPSADFQSWYTSELGPQLQQSMPLLVAGAGAPAPPAPDLIASVLVARALWLLGVVGSQLPEQGWGQMLALVVQYMGARWVKRPAALRAAPAAGTGALRPWPWPWSPAGSAGRPAASCCCRSSQRCRSAALAAWQGLLM
jgi:hypothetical protein